MDIRKKIVNNEKFSAEGIAKNAKMVYNRL